MSARHYKASLVVPRMQHHKTKKYLCHLRHQWSSNYYFILVVAVVALIVIIATVAIID
jgi:hypothetical protein